VAERRWRILGTAFFALIMTAACSQNAGGTQAAGAPVATDAAGLHASHSVSALPAGPADAAGVPPAAAATGVVRDYYVAAETVLWDFAPNNTNKFAGAPFTEDEQVFVKNGPSRIGHKYYKSLYRRYADASFRTRKATPEDSQLGMLGPVIRASVGDTVRVLFKNKTPYPASIHAHGVFYDKASEGAPYADGTTGAAKLDDAVPPGGTHTYTWQIPERAGPGPMDRSSVMWMYHSHTDEVADTNAGLVGPIVVTARGKAKADGSPTDVDNELFAYFSVVNENESPYLARNLSALARPPKVVAPGDEEAFEESNLMHSINGYTYANTRNGGSLFKMSRGQRGRWYVMTLGTEVDLHTPHWHGNTVVSMGMRTDMVQLLPGMMTVADMTADNPGIWAFHCHVNDHIKAGMQARFQVS